MGWVILCGLRLFVFDVNAEFCVFIYGDMWIRLAFDFRFVRLSRVGLFEFGLPV